MSEHTTHIPEIRRLQRSRSDRMVAGVAGGLARYFDIHPAVFRVGFVVLTLLGGAGVLIYAAAALVMPDEGKEDSIATAALRNRRDRPWPLIGLGLLAVAGAILLSRAVLWPGGDAWWLFLIAGALILWITRHPAADPSMDAEQLAAEDSRRVRRAARRLGIAVAALLALVVAAAAVFVAVFDVHLGRGVGERSHVVTSAQALESDYRLGVGSMKLDLSRLQLPPGETRLQTSVDVGELDVIVPAGVALHAHGETQLGEVEILGTVDDGRNADVDVSETGARVLVLDAHVGVGSLQVERAVR
ncbi:MAG TPA: PspC domain-containing protein [Conexibacter sp.]|nr:PspC domain-containing protein [Conexibacter sp.]